MPHPQYFTALRDLTFLVSQSLLNNLIDEAKHVPNGIVLIHNTHRSRKINVSRYTESVKFLLGGHGVEKLSNCQIHCFQSIGIHH
eukprot:1157339-Pelagomonas_calceolata.AAC.10